eukprot:TRINITY_DN1796_c0_g2_i9.p1 TRINITY_DN1796_c0_g2~~TRINITY_DN1796_c0_g2_i9.p1  ORF type:complete len:202 (+),score=72.71 TRINITY_DN1796_c0_g2_i9:162-767(+)
MEPHLPPTVERRGKRMRRKDSPRGFINNNPNIHSHSKIQQLLHHFFSTQNKPLHEGVQKFKIHSQERLRRLMGEMKLDHKEAMDLIFEDQIRTPPATDPPTLAKSILRNKEMQLVMQLTGFDPSLAAKTLILRDEIKKLKTDGKSQLGAVNELIRRIHRGGTERERAKRRFDDALERWEEEEIEKEKGMGEGRKGEYLANR